MKGSEIKNIYEKLISEISKHNKYYFEDSNPLISDKQYDNLKKQILNLEKKYSFLKSDSSPSNILGFKPSKNFEKSKHRVRMLSLSNAFNKDDLENFKKKYLIISIKK